ncbi:DUF2637 domain-containing protein [Streptomyces sp. NPDC052051]|uniref:DUF2637 domain-containing protein n=1 Tax=Streptomyces sp. NPDC052051 TaxID=3154649 RepID=UPI0034306E97
MTIGIDAGICVLLGLDLLLTWIRIPFPLLRQTAWLLTVATIAFNGAAAWPDPLGVGMHAVIPVLFVVAVEAARHAVGRIADITADKHMEGVRVTRWLLSPVPTFLLWRRMKLWELRSYEEVIKLEQERLVYQARMRSRFGRAWRRKAPVESLMPLRLARYGVPLAETAPAGLAAAGIEPAMLPPAPRVEVAVDAPAAPAPQQAAPPAEQRPQLEGAAHPGRAQAPDGAPAPDAAPDPAQNPWFKPPQDVEYQGGYDPTYEPEPPHDLDEEHWQWYEEQQYLQEQQYVQEQRFLREREVQGGQGFPEEQPQEPQRPHGEETGDPETGDFPIPAGPNRTRQLGEGGGAEPGEEDYYQVFRQSINGSLPTPREFGDSVEATYGISLGDAAAKRMVLRFSERFNAELEEDHIA